MLLDVPEALLTPRGLGSEFPQPTKGTAWGPPTLASCGPLSPLQKGSPQYQLLTVPEHSPRGTLVGNVTGAVDADEGPNAIVYYFIAGGACGGLMSYRPWGWRGPHHAPPRPHPLTLCRGPAPSRQRREELPSAA